MQNRRHMTRRDFVRRAGAFGAAAAAGPFFVRSGVFGAQGVPGPNDRVGIGYIGCGRRSENLQGKGLPAEGRCVGAADCYLPRAQTVIRVHGGKAYQDYRDLLASKDVQAVIIASPDHWHALHTIHACQAGKHVYVEKPVSLTIREGRAMVAAARKSGCIVQCGSQQRSSAKNRRGCELVRSGVLGKVHTVIGSNYPSPWECNFPEQKVPLELDWDAWCGPAEVVPYHEDIYRPRSNPGWISFRPWSGGEMTGWGAHGLDQVQWALGADETGPVEVWTEGPKFAPPVYTAPESRARGEAACSMPKVFYRYADGTLLKLENGPAGGAIFVGEKGSLFLDRDKFRSTPVELARDAPAELPVQLYRSDDHMRNWFECMRTKKLPVADIEIAHRSTTVCHLGNLARRLGRTLAWDPAKETFVGDEDACRLLDRARRKGFELPA